MSQSSGQNTNEGETLSPINTSNGAQIQPRTNNVGDQVQNPSNGQMVRQHLKEDVPHKPKIEKPQQESIRNFIMHPSVQTKIGLN